MLHRDHRHARRKPANKPVFHMLLSPAGNFDASTRRCRSAISRRALASLRPEMQGDRTHMLSIPNGLGINARFDS